MRRKFKMSWINPKLCIKLAGRIGRGVFAKRKIKKDEILMVFGGYVMTMGHFNSLSRYLQEFPYHISDDLMFGPIHDSDVMETEMINHHCDANAGFNGQIELVAMRDIDVGEQVAMDYALCMASKVLNFECHCGDKNCRGRITGDDWKSAELQKRYRGYFQPYIQAKINKK